MEDDKESIFFVISGFWKHQIVEENHPDAQQDLGEELMEYLAKYQIIVIDSSELRHLTKLIGNIKYNV